MGKGGGSGGGGGGGASKGGGGGSHPSGGGSIAKSGSGQHQVHINLPGPGAQPRSTTITSSKPVNVQVHITEGVMEAYANAAKAAKK